MKFLIILFFLFTIGLYSSGTFTKQNLQPAKSSEQNTTIYSKHWFGKLPLLENNKKPLLIHDIFITFFDLEKKFPVWTAYHLSPAVVWGNLKEERKYISDPLLPSTQTLTVKHYKGASRCDGKHPGYDKGHLAPLGSFKASPFAYQAQYLSNIVPQTKKLNQGPWRRLEEQVRTFVKKGNELKILTGPLYGQEGKNKLPPCWKAAQAVLEEIPVSYWKIIASQHKSKIKACAFLMPQNITNQKDHPKKYIVKLEQIEQKTGLNLFENTKKSVQPDCKFWL